MRSNRTLLFSLCALVAPTLCRADTTYFLFTGHTSAQTQIDENHSSVWYAPTVGPQNPTVNNEEFLVTSFDALFNWELGGAHLTIKDGSQSTLGVTLSLYGCVTNSCTLSLVDSVSVGESFFSQQFNVVNFDFASPYQIQAGHSYYATVTSTEVDTQNKAYFIKGADNLTIADTNNNPLEGSDLASPEPGTWVLMATGLGLALTSRLRRRKA